jgi:hydroxymethylpyrimidine/phosphomethylpyrimidine kinase
MTTGIPADSKRCPSSPPSGSTETRNPAPPQPSRCRIDSTAREKSDSPRSFAAASGVIVRGGGVIGSILSAGRAAGLAEADIGSQRSKARKIRLVSAVTIATSDSGGGAGIQADLLTFAAHAVYGTTVLAAGTAQNTRAVTGIETFSTRFLAKQMDAVFTDFRPAAVKIGMLFDAPRIRTVARGLRKHRARNVVLDPVMVAKSGARLLDPAALSVLKRELLPLCDLVTPNLPEAEALAGMLIRSDEDRLLAAQAISGMGARAVLVKGGHGGGNRVRDLLLDGRRLRRFDYPRIRTRATHGTGCTLSSAIAANLALGKPLEEAVERAIRYLRAGLRRGLFPGKGFGIPDHFAMERIP